MTDPPTRPIPREEPATRPDVRSYIDSHDRQAEAVAERAAQAERADRGEDVDPGNPATEPAD
jgi:hypothetical protein